MSRRTIALAAVLSFLAWATFYALSFTVDLPTTHLDGAFQSASSVYRLNAGYFPGRDFMPYLGIGPTFVIFPAFRAAGADLAASEFSTHLMTLGFSWLSVSLLWHLIFRPHSFPASLAGGASFLALTAIATLTIPQLRDAFDYALTPGNSLRPIRTAAPSIAVAIYVLGIRRLSSAAGRATLFGFATGLILLWSNDFAIPSAGLLGVLFAADAYGRRELGLRSAALYAVVAVGSWLALLTVSTAGHPLEFLRYNFIDVAQDQWWYFGPYDEASRVFDISELPKLVSRQNSLPLAVLVITAFVAARTRRAEHALVFAIGLVLLLGGVLACVGGHIGRYFGGFVLWGAVTALFASLNAARDMAEHANAMKALARRLEGLALPIAVVLSVALTLLTVQRYRSAQNAAARDPGRFYVAELGGYLGSEWKDYIGLARSTGAQPAVEEYWGVWSATRRQFSNWPVDSVIHALGRTREIARTALGTAELVITTRNSAAPEWQSWSFSQNFWFYDQLLRGWEPQAMSPTTVLWRKSGAASMGQSATTECRPGGDGMSTILFAAAPGLYRVQMDYDLARAGRNLLLVRNNISVMGGEGGFVSLDPDAKRTEFPVEVRAAEPTALEVHLLGNRPAAFKIASCSASQVPAPAQEVFRPAVSN